MKKQTEKKEIKTTTIKAKNLFVYAVDLFLRINYAYIRYIASLFRAHTLTHTFTQRIVKIFTIINECCSVVHVVPTLVESFTSLDR